MSSNIHCSLITSTNGILPANAIRCKRRNILAIAILDIILPVPSIFKSQEQRWGGIILLC